MWPAHAKSEKKIAGERSIRYKGTASIRLGCLQFDERELDSKNLERLKACFPKDYRWLDPYNHVPAEINQRVLNAMLCDSNVSTEALLQDGCPELTFPADSHLESLPGRHRIQAARDVLPLTEKW